MCPCCGKSVFADDGVVKPHGPGREGELLCAGTNRVIERLQPAPEPLKDVKP
jgi:hypothetical protein